jgi:L-asparagine transporter-like permease
MSVQIDVHNEIEMPHDQKEPIVRQDQLEENQQAENQQAVIAPVQINEDYVNELIRKKLSIMTYNIYNLMAVIIGFCYLNYFNGHKADTCATKNLAAIDFAIVWIMTIFSSGKGFFTKPEMASSDKYVAIFGVVMGLTLFVNMFVYMFIKDDKPECQIYNGYGMPGVLKTFVLIFAVFNNMLYFR